jgi:WD40 repeat protein
MKRQWRVEDEDGCEGCRKISNALPKVSHLLGSKGRVFDVRYQYDAAADRELVLSSCEDGTASLWDLKTRRALQTLRHSKTDEVLRGSFLGDCGSSVCTAGADGNAVIWKLQLEQRAPPERVVVLEHRQAQIYAVEPIGPGMLATASEDKLIFWDLGSGGKLSPRVWRFCSNSNKHPEALFFSGKPTDKASTPAATIASVVATGSANGNERSPPLHLGIPPVTDIYSDDEDELYEDANVSAYGGPRNPHHKNFIFDVKPLGVAGVEYCPLVALALSDGTASMLDLRTGSAAGNSSPTPTSVMSVKIEAGMKGLLPASGGAGLSYGHARATGLCWGRSSSSSSSSSPQQAFPAVDLAVALGHGGVAVLDIRKGLQPRSYLAAHAAACFGVALLPDRDERARAGMGGLGMVSWSSDSTLNFWPNMSELPTGSISTIPTRRHVLDNLPVLGACVTREGSVVCAGGSGETQLLGNCIPIVSLV